MSVTLDISSDVAGGILGVVLAVISYTLSVHTFSPLMGKSQTDAIMCGERIEGSLRSMHKVRNWLGFWAWLLLGVGNLLVLSLEFGLTGATISVSSQLPAFILGGGPRFVDPSITGDDIFLYYIPFDLPDLYLAAVSSCLSVETGEGFVMAKNHYPAIAVDASQNGIGTLEVFECTSAWVGSSEWTIEAPGNLEVRTESLSEEVTYYDVTWGYPNVVEAADVLTIWYGSGTSFRGGEAPVVVVSKNGEFYFAVSITVEDDHFVYSTSTTLEVTTSSEVEFVTGSFDVGHLRSSSYSLGGVIAFVLLNGDDMGSMTDVFEGSNMWWFSESLDGSDTIVYNNDQGGEERWPSLADFVEYQKGTQPVEYAFTVGGKDVTLISSWFFPVAGILALLVIVGGLASQVIGKPGGFWTYDGLSRMIRDPANPTDLSVVALVGDSKAIGFTRGSCEALSPTSRAEVSAGFARCL